ncbi:cytochrome P450 [Lophiotrema nucula]|uniref:Cytochrome P450 n=1 Tax=Lophiotrema nucula TaxID=690887 RepID=A0A6A5Z966_9PLEO|nr:cytochrome P450 [Lophiotrema nucula]
MPNASSYVLPFSTKDNIDRERTVTIASYALLLFLVGFTKTAWSYVNGRNGISQKHISFQKPVWYSHKDPIFGLDVLWMCATAVFQGRLLEVTRSMLYGARKTVSYLFLGRQAVITSDPENLKAMLAGNFHDFGIGETRKNSLRPLFGGAIFNSDGEIWQQHRTILRPFASRVRTQELLHFENYFQHLIATLPRDGCTIDIQQSFNSFTLDISTAVFLGKSTNLLSSPSQSGQRFAAAFDHAQRALSGIDDYSLTSLVKNAIFGNDRLKTSLKEIHTFLDQVLDQCMLEGPQDPTSQDSFFHTLTRQGRARQDIKYDILNLVLAGKDTTAAYLSSIWYFLSQNPSTYARLRSEISVLNGQAPTKDDLNRFPFLSQTLKEVLRLQPPVAINQRTAIRDTCLPHGAGSDGLSPMRIPRGASVGYSVYAMHRLPEYFGEDVDTFRPERWESIRPQWAFMPFHAGPRSCIGQQFAMALAKYSTIRMVQHFAAVEDRNERPWEEKLGLNCSSKHGVNVGLVVDGERDCRVS